MAVLYCGVTDVSFWLWQSSTGDAQRISIGQGEADSFGTAAGTQAILWAGQDVEGSLSRTYKTPLYLGSSGTTVPEKVKEWVSKLAAAKLLHVSHQEVGDSDKSSYGERLQREVTTQIEEYVYRRQLLVQDGLMVPFAGDFYPSIREAHPLQSDDLFAIKTPEDEDPDVSREGFVVRD